MPVQLKDIKGVLVEPEKIKHFEMLNKTQQKVLKCLINYQSTFKIGLNREKLAILIWKKQLTRQWSIEECVLIADAIIAKEHELLEVKDAGN